MALVEPAPGALIGARLDRADRRYEEEVRAFVSALERALEHTPGADRPVHVVREEGSVLHIQVYPGSSVPGGAKGGDKFKSVDHGPVALAANPSPAAVPPTDQSAELAEELKQSLRTFRGG